jgi:DNA mismatch repair protein MSH4
LELKIPQGSRLGPLPEIFINIERKKASITCTTLDLIKYNDRINDSLAEIFMLSDG